MQVARATTMVNETGGNRSGLTGQARFWFGPVSNSKFKFEFKKNEKFLKILQGATNLIVLNFLKNSFI